LQKTPKLLRNPLRKTAQKRRFSTIFNAKNLKKSNKNKFFLADYQQDKKKIKKKVGKGRRM
jgi:hypothetical protein